MPEPTPTPSAATESHSLPSRRAFLRHAGGAIASALLLGGAPARALAAPDEEDVLREGDRKRMLRYRLGREIYSNPLRSAADIKDFRLEGEADATFPAGRLRLENKLDPSLGQKSNFVFWFPPVLPADFSASWDFRAIREPGLCMVFFAAMGHGGKDIFDPSLAVRRGEYPQYHHGDIDAMHLSYFRRSKPGEQKLQVCNLRKSYGFHLVAEGADPLPPVKFAVPPYRIELIKCGPDVAFLIDGLVVLRWTDDGRSFGPVLGAGRFGFRQMAPLQAEYENFVVREVFRA